MNKIEKDVFKQRKKQKISLVLLILILYIVFSFLSGFENGTAFLSIPQGFLWLIKNFIPTENSIKYLPTILKTMLNTVLIGISATMISSFFALIMAVIGSEVIGLNNVVKYIVKIITSFFRNMPVVSWSIILLLSFKQSELTGLMALIFVTFGYLTRTFTETIDEVSINVIEALKSTGANYFQIIFQGVIPSISSQLISWILYYIENSVREVTLIGVLTGTGIGFIFNMYYRSFRYDAAGLIILIIILVVIGIELLSNKLRKKLM